MHFQNLYSRIEPFIKIFYHYLQETESILISKYGLEIIVLTYSKFENIFNIYNFLNHNPIKNTQYYKFIDFIIIHKYIIINSVAYLLDKLLPIEELSFADKKIIVKICVRFLLNTPISQLEVERENTIYILYFLNDFKYNRKALFLYLEQSSIFKDILEKIKET